ncbi:MAG: DinB family protein, partial [Acidobacteriota bacterium]
MSAQARDRRAAAGGEAGGRLAWYRRIRAATEALAGPLSPEDCTAQSMTDASPAKWHLGHTTWFFETLILEEELRPFSPYDPDYRVLFNSYYQTVGPQHPRPRRGLVTRPGLQEILNYRAATDEKMEQLLSQHGVLVAVARGR